MREPVKPLPRFRKARVIEVIRVEVCEGEGVEGDPCRLVVYYYDPNGTFLAMYDEWIETSERTWRRNNET